MQPVKVFVSPVDLDVAEGGSDGIQHVGFHPSELGPLGGVSNLAGVGLSRLLPLEEFLVELIDHDGLLGEGGAGLRHPAEILVDLVSLFEDGRDVAELLLPLLALSGLGWWRGPVYGGFSAGSFHLAHGRGGGGGGASGVGHTVDRRLGDDEVLRVLVLVFLLAVPVVSPAGGSRILIMGNDDGT